MKVAEANTYRPITITLETEKEAEELLGILWRVDIFQENAPEHTKAMLTLRDILHKRLGVPMAGVYQGTLTRNNI